MKKMGEKTASAVDALGGGEQTAAAVAEALRLSEALQRMGVPQKKTPPKLSPALGTTFDRASRFRSL